MASTPLSNIITAEQSNTFFVLLVLIKEVPPLMRDIHQRGTRVIDPSESLMERIKRKNNLSNTIFKGKFNRTARNKMADPSMNFDISLWFSILQYDTDDLGHPGDDAWITPGTLEGHLKSLKDIRNDMMHSDFSISDADFHPKLEELRCLLVKSADLVKSRFSLDQTTVGRFIDSFNTTINTLRDEPWEHLDWTSYDSTPLFNTLKSVLKRDGTHDLHQMIQRKFSHVNPATLIAGKDIPLEVSQIFTQLEIVDEEEEKKQQEEEEEQQQQWRLEQEIILPQQHQQQQQHLLQPQQQQQQPVNWQISRGDAITQTVALDDVLEIADDKGKDILIMEGIAGVGKTTIIKKLMLDSTGNNTIKGFDGIDHVLPVQCRDRGYDSLSRLVSSLMPTARKTFREDKHMMDCLQDSSVLFIFDGVDEMTKESEKILTEVLGLNMKNKFILITTRPEKKKEMIKLIADRGKVLHLRVKGVAEEKREAFIVKYFKTLQDLKVTTKDNAYELLSYLKTTGAHLQDHWKLPLNLALLTLIWGIDSSLVCSITCPIELMIQIRVITLERLKERLRNRGYSLNGLDKKIKEFVSLLSEIALTGLRDSNLMIPQSEIEKLKKKCDDLDLPSEELLGAFLLERTSWSAGGKSSFSFPHKSLQEFYGATFVFDQVFGGQMDDDLQNAYQTLKGAGLPPNLLKGVKEFINNMNVKGKTITDVLLVKEREIIGHSPSMVKYQDTLIYLLGLLHHHKSLAEEVFAREIIQLLKQSGVEEKDDWIRLLNGVRCEGIVIKTLIEMIPDIVGDDVLIRDMNVFGYSNLFRVKTPKSVYLMIQGCPSSITLLDDLFDLIYRKRIGIRELCLNYMFIHGDQSFMANVLQAIECPVNGTYRGPFPSGGGDHPPKGLLETQFLDVFLAEEEEAVAFFAFLQERKRLQRPIRYLNLSINRHLNPDVIQSIPRGVLGGYIIDSLFLPDITDDQEGRQRVHDILINLNINTRFLSFPRYQLSPPDASSSPSLGIEKLFQSLTGIRVYGSVIFPKECCPQKEEEEQRLYKNIRVTPVIRWGGTGPKGDILNMDTWEKSQ